MVVLVLNLEIDALKITKGLCLFFWIEKEILLEEKEKYKRVSLGTPIRVDALWPGAGDQTFKSWKQSLLLVRIRLHTSIFPKSH